VSTEIILWVWLPTNLSLIYLNSGEDSVCISWIVFKCVLPDRVKFVTL
jgi:hypothetical protein